MTDQQTGPPPLPAGPELGHLLELCLSCRHLHPTGYACSCLVARAAVVAELVHEVRRSRTPAWRRPRSWGTLPDGARQDLTRAGLVLVEELEGSGWRLVSALTEGRHVLPDDYVPMAVPDPVDPDATPPNGAFRVPNVVA